MTYELDIVGEDIIPYLVHFSEIGIIPEIVDADNISIRTVRLKGPRLNDFLKAESNAVQLSKVYERIGFQVGHISNHGVIHGDLRTDNIIVENNVPFLIDWGSTKIMPIASFRYCL